ncbi:MAG: metallophosphoesterase [Candidatus Pacearchaeota archaeon]
MQTRLTPRRKFEFISKAVYFPSEKILALGDMHLGYESMFRESGSLIPAVQEKQTEEDLKKIFSQLKKEKKPVEKVVFLGDVKHFFSYQKHEKNLFLELLLLIDNYVPRDNIIILKGNHEKFAEIADKKLIDYYIQGDIAFIHGDFLFKEALDKKIKFVVMGHLHPAVSLKDKSGVKSEKYKCYLTGKYKDKMFIILPSFMPIIEGTSVNEYLSDSHCAVPVNSLKEFVVHAIGENNVYDFGKLKGLIREHD